MSDSLQQLRRHRVAAGQLTRGDTPKIYTQTAGSITQALRYSLMGAIVGGFFWGMVKKNIEVIPEGMVWAGGFTFVIYSLLPLLTWLKWVVQGKRPSANFFKHFTRRYNWLCTLVVAGLVVYGFNAGYPYLTSLVKNAALSTASNIPPNLHKTLKRHERPPSFTSTESLSGPLKTDFSFFIAWLATAAGMLGAHELLKRRPRQHAKSSLTVSKEMLSGLPFRLWLGYSTGWLADLSHGTGLAAQQHVVLTLEDAAQNVLVLGGIGSGKTTRAMQPLLLQLLDQRCGGLIFDIKGDFQQAVLTFAEQTHRTLTIIGPGHRKMNLLAGLTPEVAASFLKSVFMLGGKQTSEGFWIDTATELCRNALGVLSFVPHYYSLQGLYSYLFDPESRLAIEEKVDRVASQLEEKSKRLLHTYWHYQSHLFDRFDEKVQTGVHATIAQVLSPFNHPELIDAFCTASADALAMEDVLNGAVYLVSLPLSVWGLGGKVVYSFIKLRFYNVMQQRATRSTWNQEQPAFFMCDEFQEIVSANRDGLSDLNFWDKSRSSKTIGIVSAQAISSFYAAIGDKDIAHALLQNFRQKICFRTEDASTLNYFNHLVDKVEVIRKTYSRTVGTQAQPHHFFNASSESKTENTTLVDKSVLDAQLFRKLQPNQAIALLSIQGHSMDDVINMMPVYVTLSTAAPHSVT